MKRGCLLAIDPGLQGTGLAFWESTQDTEPTWTDVISFRGKEDWIFRAEMLAREIKSRLQNETTTGKMLGRLTMVCELMEMHQSARAQMMWKSGDFQRTLVYIGMIVAHTSKYVDEVVLTKPSEWKGQLPKPVVERRLRRLIGEAACDQLQIKSHAWDAVGIGLWHLKKF
jgi:hypothetical protein